MAFVKTQPTGGEADETGAKKERKKAPTVAERFEAFKLDFEQKLKYYFSGKEPMSVSGVMGVWDMTISGHVKAAKSNSRGVFYTLFNRERSEETADGWVITTTPTVGLSISPSEVLELTDGKGAITETMLKRWADPKKGVPYGKGATAVVNFYRRTKKEDGVMVEACYRLESYEEPQKDDVLDDDED